MNWRQEFLKSKRIEMRNKIIIGWFNIKNFWITNQRWVEIINVMMCLYHCFFLACKMFFIIYILSFKGINWSRKQDRTSITRCVERCRCWRIYSRVGDEECDTQTTLIYERQRTDGGELNYSATSRYLRIMWEWIISCNWIFVSELIEKSFLLAWNAQFVFETKSNRSRRTVFLQSRANSRQIRTNQWRFGCASKCTTSGKCTISSTTSAIRRFLIFCSICSSNWDFPINRMLCMYGA